MQTLSHSNAVPINPGRNIATIAVVGIAHIALIYAVLVALDFVPVPSFVPPTVIRVLDHTRQPPPPPMDAPTPTFLHPQGPVVVEPPIPLDPLTPPADSHPLTTTGPVTETHTFVAASAAATHTVPDYPPFDRRLGHEGQVRLKLSIDENGVVTGAVIERSSGYESLDAAAVAWVTAHWRYKAAMQDGKPVPATSEANVTFRLTQD